MAIYRVENKSRLSAIRETTFVDESIKEDPDLRYILRAQPEVIEEGLFVLSEEFSNWQDSWRSIDLLGLDARGRLTVIELKRTATADHAELQAIRYAAMVSVLTSDNVVEAHQSYLKKWEIDGDAKERIQQHLADTEFDEIYTESPRIILVSAGFSKELTTSALWLNSNGLDIKCIQLQLYRNDKELLLLESSQVVPIPGTESLLVQAQGKVNEAKKQRSSQGQWLGKEVFEENIQNAREEFRGDLTRLYQWAVGLELAELASLKTWHGPTTTMPVTVPGKSALVSIYNAPDSARIHLLPGSFRNLAPESIPLMKELLGGADLADMSQAARRNLKDISDEFLAALTEAYREAKSRLGDDGDGG